MHVKQLNTSQALQTIPRKSKCVSRRKSFTSLLSWKSDRRRRNCHDLRVIWGHRTVILHIPQIYCNTLLSTNSTASILREEPVLAGLTHTPTEQNITTMGDLIIAMCFQMVCYDSEQQEDYNTRYSISLASEDNQKLYCTVKTLPRPKKLHTQQIFSLLWVECHRILLLMCFVCACLPQITTCTVDSPPSPRGMECVQVASLLTLSPFVKTESTVSNVLPNQGDFRGSDRVQGGGGLLEVP